MIAEEQIAKALQAIEPEKVIGGSPLRRQWLTLVLAVFAYLYAAGKDTGSFHLAMINYEEEEVVNGSS